MSEGIVKISDKTFEEEILKSDIPVLVDFWAEWCAPCYMVVPALENIAQDYKGKIKVAKINVDENMEIPSRHSIMSIPTLLFFKGGELKETIIGAQPQEHIIEVISKYL